MVQSKISKIEKKDYSMKFVKKCMKGLKEAVSISMNHNIPPILGTTVIILSDPMNLDLLDQNKNLKMLPSEIQKVSKVAAMLALMCLDKCETANFYYFNGDCYSTFRGHDNILEDVNKFSAAVAREKRTNDSAKDSHIFHLSQLLENHKKFAPHKLDNIIFLTGGPKVVMEKENKAIEKFLAYYRQHLNPNLVYFRTDVCSPIGMDVEYQRRHINDIFVSGFSDQILRLFADNGNGGQLRHVEKIDLKYSLKPLHRTMKKFDDGHLKEMYTLGYDQMRPLFVTVPKWRTIRAFISSTFLDMHAERDLLVRFVFPELRSRAKGRFVNLYEVDLRWGITEQESNQKSTIDLCLSQISNCDLFIGLLGSRYGYVPDTTEIQKKEEFDWIADYRPNSSITELEMYHAALWDPEHYKSTAFFYIRDPKFLGDVPKEYQDQFEESNKEKAARLEQLKQDIRGSGLEVYDGYPCKWSGVYKDIPVVMELEAFGQRVIDNIWNAIDKKCPMEDVKVTEMDHETRVHNSFANKLAQDFTSREHLVEQFEHFIKDSDGFVILAGQSGSGKTSFMAEIRKKLSCRFGSVCIAHFVGLTSCSDSVPSILRHICHNALSNVSLQDSLSPPRSYRELLSSIAKIFNQVISMVDKHFYVFVDGLDNISNSNNFDWLLPLLSVDRLTLICSVTAGSAAFEAVQSKFSPRIFNINRLSIAQREEIVKDTLAKHNKALDDSPFNNVMRELTTKRDADLPLYLQLACQQLRHSGLYKKMEDQVQRLGNTIKDLLSDIFTKMEVDIGSEIVKCCLCVIALSNHNLEKYELLEILNLYTLTKDKIRLDVNSVAAPNCPLAASSRLNSTQFIQLLQLLEGILKSLDSKDLDYLVFAHEDVKEVVKEKYLNKSPDSATRFHTLLAGYFKSKVNLTLTNGEPLTDSSALNSLAHHLHLSGHYQELGCLLTNFYFVFNMMEFNLKLQLVESYLIEEDGARINPMIRRQKTALLADKRFLVFKNFVFRNAQRPKIDTVNLLQLAVDEPRGSKVRAEAIALMGRNPRLTDHLIMPENEDKMAPGSHCLATIPLEEEPTCMCALSSESQSIFVGCLDGRINIYKRLTCVHIGSLVGHSGAITALQTVDGRRLISSSTDGTLSVWDLSKRTRLHSLEGHERSVVSFSIAPSKMTIASVGLDCKLIFWAISSGFRLSSVSGSRSALSCICYFPRTHALLYGGFDHKIKWYDDVRAEQRASLKGHFSRVRSIEISLNEETATSISATEIIVWLLDNRIIKYLLPFGSKHMATISSLGAILLSGCIGTQDSCRVSFNRHNDRQNLDRFELFQADGDKQITAFANYYNHIYVALNDRRFYHLEGHIENDSFTAKKETFTTLTETGIPTIIRKLNAYIYIGSSNGTVNVLDKRFNRVAILETDNHTSSITTIVMCPPYGIIVADQDGFLYYFTQPKYAKTAPTYHHEAKIKAHKGRIIDCQEYTFGRIATCGTDNVVNFYDLECIRKGKDIQFSTSIDCRHESPASAFRTSKSIVYVAYEDGVIKKFKSDQDSSITCCSFDVIFEDTPIFILCLNTCLFVGLTNGRIYSVHNERVQDRLTLNLSSLVNKTFIYEQLLPVVETVVAPNYFSSTEKKERNYWSEFDEKFYDVFDPLCSFLVLSDQRTLSVVTTKQVEVIDILDGHLKPITDIAHIGPNLVGTCSKDNTVKLWDLKVMPDRPDRSTKSAPVTHVAISPYGDLSFAHSDGCVLIWKKDDNSLTHRLVSTNNVSMPKRFEDVISLSAAVDQLTIVYKSTLRHFKLDDQSKLVEPTSNEDDPTLISSFSLFGNKINEFAVFGTPDGYVTLCRIDRTVSPPKCKLIFFEKFLKEKVVHVCAWIDEGLIYLYAADSSNYIFQMTIPIIQTKWDEECCSARPFFYAEKCRHPGYFDGFAPLSDITTLKCCQAFLLVGNNDGVFSIFRPLESADYFSNQVHDDKITASVIIDHFIFTASFDGSIKIWLCDQQSRTLTQIAQFECDAPVHALDAKVTDGSNVLLMYGDGNGMVRFLNWAPKSFKFSSI